MTVIESSLQKLTRFAYAKFDIVAGLADRNIAAVEDTARHEFMTDHLTVKDLLPSAHKKNWSNPCPRD